MFMYIRDVAQRLLGRTILKKIAFPIILLLVFMSWPTPRSYGQSVLTYFYSCHESHWNAPALCSRQYICFDGTFETSGTANHEVNYTCPNGAAVKNESNLDAQIGDVFIHADGEATSFSGVVFVSNSGGFDCDGTTVPPLQSEFPQNCYAGGIDPNGGGGGSDGGSDPCAGDPTCGGRFLYCYQTCSQVCSRTCDDWDDYGHCYEYSDWDCSDFDCRVECY
jgi:hypothetical protein